MTPEVFETIMQALQASKGDDLERAEHAFANMSDAELDLPGTMWGTFSRRQTLEGYRQRRKRVLDAASWVAEQRPLT